MWTHLESPRLDSISLTVGLCYFYGENDFNTPVSESIRNIRVSAYSLWPLEGVMNLAEKPHWDADSSVSSVLRRSPVFRISKRFLSKFITSSSEVVHMVTDTSWSD
jgi:hypothetical protein